MQFFGRGKPSAGAFFDSDFTRLDQLLAMALLYGLQGKNDCRVACVSCSRPDLTTVGFLDAVERYYHGPSRNFSQTPPVGMRTEGSAGSTPRAFQVTFENKVKSVIDTSDPSTLFRNYLAAQNDGNAFFVLSGPAVNLAAAMRVRGVPELVKAKIRTLVVDGQVDPVLRDWPTPVVVAGPEVALPFPDWTPEDPADPVFAAWQAGRGDGVKSTAVAAAFYAGRPKSELFTVSSGRLAIADREGLLKAYAELVSAKPVIRMRFRPDAVADAAADKAAEKQ